MSLSIDGAKPVSVGGLQSDGGRPSLRRLLASPTALD